jgi:hypothetical protein
VPLAFIHARLLPGGGKAFDDATLWCVMASFWMPAKGWWCRPERR